MGRHRFASERLKCLRLALGSPEDPIELGPEAATGMSANWPVQVHQAIAAWQRN